MVFSFVADWIMNVSVCKLQRIIGAIKKLKLKSIPILAIKSAISYITIHITHVKI